MYTLILILILNYDEMEIVTHSYNSLEQCQKDIIDIKDNVATINEFTYPIKVSSAVCVADDLNTKRL